MSTTTVSVRSTRAETSLREVRRREAEAREAARRSAERAARLAEEARRREAREREVMRRRLEAANGAVRQQDGLYQQAVARLDEARRRLPDLALGAPALAAPGSDVAGNPDKLEAHAAQMALAVERFTRELDTAIGEAERLLARRLAKAAAWREAGDLERQAAALRQAGSELAARLDTAVEWPALPERPGSEAELESVQAYLAGLQDTLQELRREHDRLVARDEARSRAAALSGPGVLAREASATLAQHAASQGATARARLRAVLDMALASAGLDMEEVSAATQLLIEAALNNAHGMDRGEQVLRWVAVEKQRRDGVGLALAMLQNAPVAAFDDGALARRWQSVLAQLQRVASGIEEFTSSLEREYEQIHADVRRNLGMAFTKADWVKAMSEQGFEIITGEGDQGLVVVDLDHPEVWLEGTEMESPEGDYVVVLDLKTDGQHSGAEEAAVTAKVCARLGDVAGAAAHEVRAQAEVIEQASRIARGSRPARARKALAAALS